MTLFVQRVADMTEEHAILTFTDDNNNNSNNTSTTVRKIW